MKKTNEIQNIKVRNMRSNNETDIPNQFIIETNGKSSFQSYQTIIAIKDNKGTIYLDRDCWDCSKTTGKYRNQFLNETKKETEKKIKNGEYILMNLN